MFPTCGTRGGPGIYAPKLWAARYPISKVRSINGQVIGNTLGPTQVNWDTLVIDEVGAFKTPGGGVFTTPLGYNKCRPALRSSWQSNNNGIRAQWLLFNGSLAFMYCTQLQRGTSFNQYGGGIGGRWFDTVPGDQWSMGVGQSSGGNLTWSPAANGPGQAWFQIEWASINRF